MPDLHQAPTTRDPTRDLRVFPTSPSLSHSGPAQSRGPRPGYTTHSLAHADPRAALTAAPTRSRRFDDKGRSTTQCKQRRRRGRPRFTAAAARVLAALFCRSRTPTLRALAKRSVSRSFVRSAGRRLLRSGRRRAALPAPLHAAPLVHSSRRAAAFATARHSAAARRGGLRLLRLTRSVFRRASLRGHTPVAATARRPPAAESLLLAARRGDARTCCSRPLGRTPRSRQLGTRPSVVAAACASCAERGASHAPCSSARSHARGRDGSTAASRRVAAARRSSRRRSHAPLAPARSAAALATARHSAAAARCSGLRLLR